MNYIKFIFFSVIILILGGGIFLVLKTESIPEYDASISIDEHDIIFGDDSAQLTVIMYSSYQCNFCRKIFNEVLPLLKTEFIDNKRIRFVVKPIELAPSKLSYNALKTVVCINKYGNIKKLHELLLLDPQVVYTREFEQVTEEFIEQDPFVAECMLNGEAENYLKTNDSIFLQLGLTGTPAFIINNKVYKGYHDYSEFSEIIEKELKKSLR